MESQPLFTSRSGLSLVGVITLMVVVAVGAVMLMQLFSSQQNVLNSLDKKDKAFQIVNGTIDKMNRMDFSQLEVFCRERKVLDVGNPATGSCSVEGKLNTNPSGSTDIASNPFQLEVLRTWEGDNNPNGNVCIEIGQCTSRAGGNFLDVALTVYYKDHSQSSSSRLVTFRRTRW
ncbi:hypothetical protein EBT16_10215 [bacterium]|nr:hypothetical protein [bacterium]NBY18826.1 hypothetical protein [bacterium]